MKLFRIILLFLCIFIAPIPSYMQRAYAQTVQDPQYIFVRKDPMACNPSDCSMLWNMSNDKITLDAINDVYNSIGTHGSPTRKIGIGVIVNYNEYDNIVPGVTFQNVQSTLRSLLIYSRVHNFPLFIQLDGYQFLGDKDAWNGRPDLWNWFDQSHSSYNDANRNNVEWTCWDNSCAVSKAWRNWGFEFEIRPPPNLASRTFIDANKARITPLISLIVSWYNNELTDDQKWLLGGVSLGNEIDMGGNYYYYPNGVSSGKGIMDSVQLGYAAVKTAGIRSSGAPPTTTELNEVVKRYINEMNQTAVNLGIPRHKIYNQVGAFDFSPNPTPATVHFTTADSAVTPYGYPGYSMYGDVTVHPENYPGLAGTLTVTGSTNEWASPEWLTYASTQSEWENAIRKTLSYRNNRFLNIANWEGMVRGKPEVLAAIRTVANESQTCWVSAPKVTTAVSGNSVVFSVNGGSNVNALYLNVSTSNALTNAGVFTNINVVNSSITGLSSYTKSGLANGIYYWLTAADGCTNQRRMTYGSFTIGSSPTVTPLPTLTTVPPTTTQVPKSGDGNTDGMVDGLDYIIWLTHFGQVISGRTNGDFNNSGRVDGIDYVVWLTNFGK